ncbi:MAG: hypothetical protein ACP5IE_03920 [Infirmifilum sp.]
MNYIDKSKAMILSGYMASGKTTVCRYLAEYLNDNGFKAGCVYISAFHIFSYLLSNLMLALSYSPSILKKIKRTGIHPLSLVFHLWCRMRILLILLEIISIYIIYLIKVFLPLKLHLRNILLIDEGPIHALAMYIALTHDMKKCMYKNAVKYGKLLILNILRITLHLLREVNVTIYYFQYDLSSEFVYRVRRRGWPQPLGKILSQENIMAFNEVFNYGKRIFEKTLDVKVLVYDTSGNKLSIVLNQILKNVND